MVIAIETLLILHNICIHLQDRPEDIESFRILQGFEDEDIIRYKTKKASQKATERGDGTQWDGALSSGQENCCSPVNARLCIRRLNASRERDLFPAGSRTTKLTSDGHRAV